MHKFDKIAGTGVDIMRVAAVSGAILLGSFMLYGVGFAPIAHAHNAAHDGRHAFAPEDLVERILDRGRARSG